VLSQLVVWDFLLAVVIDTHLKTLPLFHSVVARNEVQEIALKIDY